MGEKVLINKELDNIYSKIGLSNSYGVSYKERLHKHKQIYEYIKHIRKAISKLSTKRELVLVDCACGKSYVSFVAYYYLKEIEKRNIKIIGIDYNEHVINESKQAATELGFEKMEFICSDIFKVDFHNIKPDVVYSLHACDTATDMTLAKGLIEEAKFIFTVSCCQHTVRKSLRKHPLSQITKHGIYKERFADMFADSLRTLVLESMGYKVKVFEFVPTSETPKNVMIRAFNTGNLNEEKSEKSKELYTRLKEMFNCEPMLREYLEKCSSIRW